MRLVLTSTALALAASLAPLSASAQAPSCTHNVGMVVSLTGAAGRFGQAASKSVELAFGELNKAAGAQGIAVWRSRSATPRARAPWPWTRPASWWT